MCARKEYVGSSCPTVFRLRGRQLEERSQVVLAARNKSPRVTHPSEVPQRAVPLGTRRQGSRGSLIQNMLFPTPSARVGSKNPRPMPVPTFRRLFRRGALSLTATGNRSSGLTAWPPPGEGVNHAFGPFPARDTGVQLIRNATAECGFFKEPAPACASGHRHTPHVTELVQSGGGGKRAVGLAVESM